MSHTKSLDDNEQQKISHDIAEKTYYFFDKKLRKEIAKILNGNYVLHKNGLVLIHTSSIFDVMLNVFRDSKKFIETEKINVDFKILLKMYIKMLNEQFDL